MNRFLEVKFVGDRYARLLSGLVIVLVSFWEFIFGGCGSVVVWESDFKISRICKIGRENFIKDG